MNIELSVEETISSVIQGELREIVYFEKAPYIKFQLIATSIEFLGACLDNREFDEKDQSEIRFNKALQKLFPKKYHKYAKKDSLISLYTELRCGMVHKLRPLTSVIQLTERKNLLKEQDINLTEINGNLFIVLEDIYEDLNEACNKLKLLNSKSKLPTKKLSNSYLKIKTTAGASTQLLSSGHTDFSITTSTGNTSVNT